MTDRGQWLMSVAVDVTLGGGNRCQPFIERLRALDASVTDDEASWLERRAQAALAEAYAFAERLRAAPHPGPGHDNPEWRRGVSAITHQFPGVTEEQANRLIDRGMIATR